MDIERSVTLNVRVGRRNKVNPGVYHALKR
jgi:hypothetical protein